MTIGRARADRRHGRDGNSEQRPSAIDVRWVEEGRRGRIAHDVTWIDGNVDRASAVRDESARPARGRTEIREITLSLASDSYGAN